MFSSNFIIIYLFLLYFKKCIFKSLNLFYIYLCVCVSQYTYADQKAMDGSPCFISTIWTPGIKLTFSDLAADLSLCPDDSYLYILQYCASYIGTNQ